MEFRDTGGSGPPVVFLHGLLVDGTLWDAVVDRLPDHRCVVPTLPLGSHTVPVADRSVLTPVGVADLVADLLERLDLRDVTVVASDTGGAIAQLLVTRRPSRVSRLVLTPCDALEVFPPALFVPLFKLGRFPPLLSLFLQPLRLPRRAPAADRVRLADEARVVRAARGLGRAGAARPRDPAATRRTSPVTCRRRSRWTSRRGCGRSRARCVLAWPPEDRCFPIELGRRLAAQFSDARLVEVDDSYSFVAVDQPDVLARL